MGVGVGLGMGPNLALTLTLALTLGWATPFQRDETRALAARDGLFEVAAAARARGGLRLR